MRRPIDWREVDLEWALDRIAERFIETGEATFRMRDGEGNRMRNTEAYLFTARKRAASMDELERWRDEGRRVAVRFSGVPDLGARALRIDPAQRSPGPSTRL